MSEKVKINSEKKYMTMLIITLVFGVVGIHRFYVGKTLTGILYLFTGGLFGFGWIVDLFQVIAGNFTDKGGNFIKR